VTITLNIYSHVAPTVQADAADRVAAIMRGTRQTDGGWTVPATLFVQVRGLLSVSEGGLGLCPHSIAPGRSDPDQRLLSVNRVPRGPSIFLITQRSQVQILPPLPM